MQMKMMITPGGKHPAYKWAQYAADEIIDISAQAPETLLREAMDFRGRLANVLTGHHQFMMDDEQNQIKAGNTALDLPYVTEAYAKKVSAEICDQLAKGTSFANHFAQNHVGEWVEGICNKYFKSAKMVERQHFHTENSHIADNTNNNG